MKRCFPSILLLLCVLGLASAGPIAAQTPALEAQDALGNFLFRVNTDAGLVALGTAEAGDVPATGEGVRMMWFPGRWAFRAGRVWSFGATYWDLANIGIGSAAFGENTRASGNNSFAAGLATTAGGDESVALGNNGTASADRAFAFNGTASAVAAVAIGSGAQATSDDALALGPSSIASGLASVTIGPSIARGAFAVAIGLQNSASGNFSIAIGKNARTANRQGSIVLGDGCAGFSSDSVYATANNQFVARGCGGIRFYTSQNLSTGVFVAPGGGSWASVSDRNLKDNFRAVDGEDVLRRLRGVPVSTWNYETQDAGIRHMGPMAQDFRAAFALGEDSTTINTVDIDGVTLAGVQALSVRTDDLRAENEALRAELTAMRERLDALDGGGPGPVQAALPWLGGLTLLGIAGAGLRRRRSAARAD
ncbi:MAG TPA: tail fiber domain-containing protein [Rhodothermales bacterium]|nr:tail fiber domain-containing protein [Rhodothermales bacterium]